MKRQHISSQKGEIQFKKKLYQQQVDHELVFTDEYDAKGMESVLKERMDTTRDQMSTILTRGIPLTPYLEIGAERCQRSLIMENDLGANGFAADLSYEMLKSCAYYQKVFRKEKAPIRICCDVNNLPFKSNTFRFIFCYQTLHHFPDPSPVTKGIHRILAPGGFLFFDEEPFKRILHVNLYRGAKAYSEKALRKSRIRNIIDYFFMEANLNENEYGIVENDDLTIAQWKQALNHFTDKKVQLKALGSITSDLFSPKSLIRYWEAYLLGGVISGLCRKQVTDVQEVSSQISLICPSCLPSEKEVMLAALGNDLLSCPTCRKSYPIVDGIAFLFEYKQFQELYPDIYYRVDREASK